MTIHTIDLAHVIGGVGPAPGGRAQSPSPSNTNNLGAWGLPSASDIMNAKPVDNRVLSQPNNPFPSPNMNVTSPQDNSWMQRIPWGQMGM